MRRIGQPLVALALAAGAALSPIALPQPAAAADAYQQALRTYQATGSIPPCRFTAPQLQGALAGIDTYGAQYFADFTDAIQAALTARAAGGCGTPAAPRRRIRASATVASLPSVTAPTSAGIPAPLIVLGAVGVLGALGGGTPAALAAARRRRQRTQLNR